MVSYRHGAAVRLDQIAHVIDNVEDNKNASWLYTKAGARRAINLQVMRQPGSNTIEVTDAVRALLPSFQQALPPSVHLTIRGDRSKNIREAFSDIQWTMLITLLLVVAVIFAFLHSGSATLIPALALPFSILGTFAVMQVLNFTLDNLSMMALILSIGFVVDDAIVMLENIVRHIEQGKPPLEAALTGSKEVGFTIVSMTMSLAAVFIPILFMSGILGRLFREFAITITTAILISGVVSVTLTPMLASRFLRVASLHGKGRFARLMESLFQRAYRAYEWSLGIVLRHRPVMLGVFVAVLAATVAMFEIVPKGFIPDQDNDTLNVNVQAAQGTSYYDMVAERRQDRGDHQRQSLRRHLLREHRRRHGVDEHGALQRAADAAAQPAAHRGADRAAAPAAAAAVPGLPRLRQPAAGDPDRRPAGQQLVHADGPERRHQESLRLGGEARGGDRAAARGAGRLRRSADEEPARQPGDQPRPGGRARAQRQRHRDRALRRLRPAVGVDDLRLAVAVQGAARARSRSTRSTPTRCETIAFKTSSGALVPLQSVLTPQETVGPQTVNHVGELPAVSISFGLRPGVSLGAAVDHVNKRGRVAAAAGR